MTMKRTIELTITLIWGAWNYAIRGDCQSAFRITKALKALPKVKYSKKRRSLDFKAYEAEIKKNNSEIDEDDKPEFTMPVTLWTIDINWLFAQVCKLLDGQVDPQTRDKHGPSPADIETCQIWAEALGYDKDQSFLDKVTKYLNWYDSEPKEEEEKKAEDKPAEEKK